LKTRTDQKVLSEKQTQLQRAWAQGTAGKRDQQETRAVTGTATKICADIEAGCQILAQKRPKIKTQARKSWPALKALSGTPNPRSQIQGTRQQDGEKLPGTVDKKHQQKNEELDGEQIRGSCRRSSQLETT
jgi:hypothetical protein